MTQSSDNGIDIIKLISHDLNGPLGGVKGYLELIGRVGELNPRQTHFFERAMNGIDRLEQTIERVLDLMKIDSLNKLVFETCDIKTLVEKCVLDIAGMAEVRDIRIITQLDQGLPPLWGHPGLLQHMLLNLLANAIKYNNDGGHVWISVSYFGTQIRIDVQDDGQGISAENLPLIFGHFYRELPADGVRKDVPGMGIGLAIVKLVVDRHEGMVDVKSVKGEGTLFSVFLTAADDAVTQDSITFVSHIGAAISNEDRETLDDLDDSLQELHDTSHDEDSNHSNR